MAGTNNAQQLDVFVDVTTLNAYPLADVFVAVGPARVVAENVTVGPVMTDEGVQYLVRIEGRADVLKETEADALEAAAPQVLRYLARLTDRRFRAEAEAKRRAEVAASIARCPGHQLREVEISRCLYRIVCSCGYVETVSTDD